MWNTCRSNQRSKLIAFTIACALVTLATAGDDPRADAPKALVLFDGKSLDGWKQTGTPKSGEVAVADQAIVVPEGRSICGVTSTRKDLPKTNYELSYEATRLDGNDFFAAATFPVGDSFVTFVNGGWSGNITGLSSLNGADASENETTTFVKFENKIWYKFRVRVTDRVIRCWVDPKEVVAVDYQGSQVSTRIETRGNQPLGFATWQTKGAVRKIEIRPLTPAEIAANDKLDASSK